MHKKNITETKLDVDNVLAPDTNVKQCKLKILVINTYLVQGKFTYCKLSYQSKNPKRHLS